MVIRDWPRGSGRKPPGLESCLSPSPAPQSWWQRHPPVGNSTFISKSRLRGPQGPGQASRLCGSAVRPGEAGLPGLPGVPAAGQAVHVLLLDVLVAGLAGERWGEARCLPAPGHLLRLRGPTPGRARLRARTTVCPTHPPAAPLACRGMEPSLCCRAQGHSQPGTHRGPGVPRTEVHRGLPTTAPFNKGRARGSVRTSPAEARESGM